jgi:hypothetical protein
VRPLALVPGVVASGWVDPLKNQVSRPIRAYFLLLSTKKLKRGSKDK